MEKNKYKIVWEHWMPPHVEEEDYVLSEEDKVWLENQGVDLEVILPHQENYAEGIMTELGVQPVDRNYNPFNFWILHTNFHITRHINDIVVDTPGVEVCQIFTPYRLKIAIGKAFDVKEVINNLQKNMIRNAIFGVI